MEKETLVMDVREQVLAHLKDDDRSLLWMHDKIIEKCGNDKKIPYGTLYSCLHQRLFKMSDDNLKIINETLGTNFQNQEQ